MMLLACSLTQTMAQAVHYRFVPQDYVSTDNNRAPQDRFSYTDTDFTIRATGQNNVAFKMGSDCNSKYYITGQDHWFVVRGSHVKTGTADTYLWWSGGTNVSSQVAPDYVVAEGEYTYFIWNMLNGNALFSWFNADSEKMVQTDNGRGSSWPWV